MWEARVYAQHHYKATATRLRNAEMLYAFDIWAEEIKAARSEAQLAELREREAELANEVRP